MRRKKKKKKKEKSLFPSIDSIIADEKEHAKENIGSNLEGLSEKNIHLTLRAFIDDITFKVPRLLSSVAEDILCVLFQPAGATFNDKKKQVWDINANPQSGVELVGMPLWGPEVDFQYRVGSKSFCEHEMYKSIVERHEAQLAALEKVLLHAPHARDAGTAVERTLRICVVSRLVHIARILPPCFSVDLLKHCHELTMNFVVQPLYAW